MKYTIQAKKEGFLLKEISEGVFQAQKLASLQIIVKSESNEPLQGVLVSLSGENIIKNEKTNELGIFQFENLYPGGYYVKPLLKEYVFNSSQYFDLLEGTFIFIIFKLYFKILTIIGEDRTVIFSATRISFSCFGKVTLLNKHPLKSIVVEATSQVFFNLLIFLFLVVVDLLIFF